MDMTHITSYWHKLLRKEIQLKANMYLPKIIFALLLLLLIQTLADLTWRIFTPAQKMALSVKNQAVSINTQKSSSSLSEVSQYHLFGNAKKLEVTPQAIISAPDTRLRLDLKGVFASNKASQALAIISSNKGKDKTFHIGDKVKGGVLLHAVYTDRVILKRNGKLETLRLPKPKVNSQSFYSKPPSRVAALNRLPTNTQQSNALRLRKLRSTLLNDPTKLWQQVRISPVMRNGKIKGYTLSHNDQALMKALNIRSSDIITSVNGQSLSEPSTLYGLMNSLSEQKSLLLNIERNGQPQTVELTF